MSLRESGAPVRHHRRFASCGLALALSATPAFGQEAAQCARAYEQTQLQRRTGHLVEARASAIECSAQSCPQVLAKDCSRWVAEIEPAIPRVVLSIKDAEGAPLAGTAIYLDGTRLADVAGGQSIEVNPGEHVLRFERPGQPPIERRTLFIEGEKNHRVRVAFDEPRAGGRSGAPPAKRRSPPTAAIIAAGVSAAALVTSAIFGVRALRQRAELERSQCKPRCDPTDALALERSAAFADIAGAVAIVAAGSSIYLFLSQPPAPVAPSPSAGGPRGLGLAFRGEF